MLTETLAVCMTAWLAPSIAIAGYVSMKYILQEHKGDAMSDSKRRTIAYFPTYSRLDPRSKTLLQETNEEIREALHAKTASEFLEALEVHILESEYGNSIREVSR